MIIIKSKREIEIMKEAGRITAYAHRRVQEAIKPGISTAELDKKNIIIFTGICRYDLLFYSIRIC